MAYIVGSASVSIIPDFRQAQLAITAWYAKQGDLQVQVKTNITPETTRVVEQQAREAGNRVGRAIADGVEKSAVNRDFTSPIARQIAKLEADIEKSQTKGKEATDALRLAQLRLKEARDAGNRSASTMLGLEQSVERAQNRVAEAERNGIRAADALREARRQLDIETQQSAEATANAIVVAKQREFDAQVRLGEKMAKDVERQIAARQTAAQREFDAQVRLGEQMTRDIERQMAARQKARDRDLQQTIRTIEREATESQKIRDRANKEAIRAQEAAAKEVMAALNKALKDNEEARLKIELDREQIIMEGRTAGGLVARAIKQELHQNAGLITAAVTGALVLGGPAVMAATSGLFVGIGAVGAFQSQKLRQTWKDTFSDIADAGIADSAVLIPAFERMASGIGASFERVRPMVQRTFAALPDQIDVLNESLGETVDNLMPGLMRTVQSGLPVMRGFGDFLEKTGQGTTEFLDNISARAPAAGQSFSYLGDSMGELLPTIGELAGEGAELGTIVLPVLNSALGGLRSVVEGLGGSLPILATGFLAFRSIQGTGRYVSQVSQAMLNAAPNIGVFTQRLTGSSVAGERVMSGVGRASGAVAAFGRALPGIGIGVAGVSMVMASGKQRIDDYANAILAGGAAARKAAQDMADPSAWDTITTGFTNLFDADMWKGATTSALQLEDVNKKVRELEASMSPLELAQSRLAGWTKTLSDRMGDESASAEDVAIAQRKVAEYSAKTASEQEKLERATRGVTEAMAEQADAARARVDAEFGYQQSVLDVQEAYDKYQSTLKDTEATAADVAQALLDVNTALRDQATAAGDKAMANLPASMDDAQRAILGAKGSLDELNAMIAMGIVLPPEMEEWRQSLIGITGQADGAKLAQAQLSAALGEVGAAVVAIPDTKSVQITAPTDDVIGRLQELGFTVERVPGSKDVVVTAETEEAKGNLGNLSELLNNVGDMNPTPIVGVNAKPLEVGVAGAQNKLDNLDGQRPTPLAALNDGSLVGTALNDMGLLGDLAEKRPTPVAGLNSDPLNTGVNLAQGAVGVLDRSRANPIANLIDNASGPIRNVWSNLNLLQNRTITLTTIYRTLGTPAGGAPLSVAAPNRRDGGEIPAWGVQGLALGGIPRQRASGATWGRGGPRDDLVPLWASPGEHMLDAKDVALMGGQAGVYAFREMLNAGAYSGPGADTGISRMVSTVAPRASSSPSAGTPPRSVSLYTPDIPAALRELKAVEHREQVLASPWP